MITNTQLLNDLQKQLSSQKLSENQKISLAMRYKQLLIDMLKVGDLIKGTVKSLGENSYVLEIRPHVQIPVVINDTLKLDERMSFIVKEKTDGKLFISSIENANIPSGDKVDIIDKVIDEFALPKNKIMKEIISDFISKQLPLDKNMLMKTYYFTKEFNIPSKVLANLAAYEKPWSDTDLRYVQTLRENGVTSISASIKNMISQIPLVEDLKEVFNILAKDIKSNDLHQILKIYIGTLDINDLNMSDINISDLSTSDLDINDLNISDLKVKTNILSNESGKNENNTIMLAGKDIPEVFLKDTDLFKKVLLELYDKRHTMDMQKLKLDHSNNEKELDKVFSFTKTAKEVLEVLEKLDAKPDEKREINALKENVKVITSLNQEGHHFIFPMTYHDQVLQGELYFLKPQKYRKNTKESVDNIYIVLALDMPHIEHIEIHINKQGKEIYLTFNVIDEEVRKHITKYTDQIENEINTLGYKIKGVLWGYLNSEDEKELPFKESVYESLSHMDIKA